MPSIIFKTNIANLDIVASGRKLPSFKDIMNISITFGLITFAWIFFRAENVEQAFSYISRMLNPTIMSIPNLNKAALATIILIGFLLIIEWIGREDNFALEKLFVNSNIAGEGNYQLVR